MLWRVTLHVGVTERRLLRGRTIHGLCTRLPLPRG
jgi:hypothetical protein